jgi:two-component system phosphate regulon sensor histidine kinase PhoR
VSPRVAAAAVVVATVGVLLGRTLDGALAALAVATLAALLVAAVLEQGQRTRLRALADRLGAWMGDDTIVALPPERADGWRQLTTALNALGAGYQRRGERVARERPWRRQLVDSLVQPALLFSGEGRLQAANDAARELLGIPIDAGDVTVVQAVGSAPLTDAVREARRAGGPVTLDVEHGDHDLRAVVSLVGDETLMIISDRTRERRVEELRRNFVVNASHELKTPVTSIKTLAEALQVTVGADPARVPGLVSQLGVESERLARLVRDLLDLRRLEERGPLERVPVDLAELARLTVAEAMERPEVASLELELGVEAPDTAVVVGVPTDLEVIVKNLVHNAVQYNRPGGEVEVELEPHDGTWVMRVRDGGIGIPQHDLARVFERFYRVDAARSRETGGTGLGLSIVRHAVERHGGHIRVDSLLGEGTTFTVTLPVEPPR